AQGVLHADFALTRGGEEIVITESDGHKTIDSYEFGPQQTDISYGRNPDGSDNWQTFAAATPGASNGGPQPNQAPSINNVSATPGTVTDSTIVTVSAEVTDADGNITSVVLSYGPEGAINSTETMTASGINYSAEIGPFADGSIIKYFISATDDSAATTISDTLEIRVGYIPPVLFINEFLASNDSCCTDEYGDYDDWIEIYNPDTIAVDIGGMYITDDLTDKMKWQIPTSASDSTTVPPAGFLVLWADGETDQGILHLDIKLSGSGE
ncbi:MAG: lamin tail domain-containing protein, partial [Gammaproteobacteria bacterium]|nr:lamin tail domain-containing protein [Gammaproteobacteria bacterium]